MRADLDLEVATEFLLIAATLVELKARRLLPGDDDVDLDDELALWEERDLLLARLLECKTFKDAAPSLCAAGRRRRPLATPAPPGSTSASSTSRPTCWPASPPPTCAPPSCGPPRRKPVPAGRPRPRRPDPRLSVAEAVAELVDELPRARPHHVPAPHRGARRAARGRRAVPGRARAYKQGLVDLDQPDTFGEHRRSPGSAATPTTRRAAAGPTSLAGIDVYDG